MSKQRSILIAALAALVSPAAAQTVSFNPVFVSGGFSGSGGFSYGSGGASVGAGASGIFTHLSSATLQVNWQIKVIYDDGGTLQNPPTATGSYVIALEDSADADASSGLTNGNASGDGNSGNASAAVSVSGIDADADFDDDTPAAYTGSLSSLTFTRQGTVWVATLNVTSRNLSANGYLNHPSRFATHDYGDGDANCSVDSQSINVTTATHG